MAAGSFLSCIDPVLGGHFAKALRFTVFRVMGDNPGPAAINGVRRRFCMAVVRPIPFASGMQRAIAGMAVATCPSGFSGQ